MLTNEQITHLKKELEEARHDILSRFKENDQFQLTDEFPYQSSGELSSYDNHPGDQATELYEREKDLALLDHEREHLRDIDYSLKQIENGTYGTCEVSGKVFGYPGVNWAVPFFGFVILMALGVDYSIFLMDRFNELKKEGTEPAMISSMKNMGSVIISSAIILAGTFAAMLPSGVLSLLQIATVVLTGLLMYAIVVLPFFVPVMVKIFGRANWWPFNLKK